MNLQRCHIQGFGRLANLPLILAPGLNLIFAHNEGGKSTLLHFLIGMLYGQLRADAKVRRLEPWIERYRPWTGADFGGILWCELAGGRHLEIRRDFGKDEYRVEIRTLTGEDITADYEHLKTGEVLFASRHLSLSKELFESVAVVRETGTAELGGRETITDRIANLAHSGDEDLSVQQSILRLQQALDSIGSERAPTKPYRRTLDRLESLQLEKRALEVRRREYQAGLEERFRLSADVGRLDHELLFAKSVTATARLGETAQKCRTLEQIRRDTDSTRAEIQALHADPEFPAHRLDELNTLQGSREATAERLVEVRRDIENATARTRQLEEEMAPMASYGQIYSSGEGEKISEWFHRYLALSLQRDETQRGLAAVQTEIHSLEGILNSRPFLRDSQVDWEQRAREIAEAERTSSERMAALAGELSQGRSELQVSTSRARGALILSIVSSAAALLPLWWRLFPGAVTLTPPIGLMVVVIFGSAVFASLLAAARFLSTSREIRRKVASLELEQERLREEARQIAAPLRRAVTESGLATVDEFLASAREVGQILYRLEGLHNRLGDLRGHFEQMDRDADKPFSDLRDCLGRIGLACSPGNLSAAVDAARNGLRRYRDLELRWKGNVERLESLHTEEEELRSQLDKKDAAVGTILSQAGVASPEAFRKAAAAHRRLLQLRDREVSLGREFERVGEGETLDHWHERLRRLEAAPELVVPEPRLPAGATPVKGRPGVPALPYPPGVEEAEQAEKKAAAALAAGREELARIEERLSQAFSSLRTLAEIDEDIAIVEAELRTLRQNRRALEIAVELIETRSRQQQEVLAPQLNRAVEARFVPLCSGRYSEVKIDPDFNILARETGTNELRPMGQLSQGTQDQLYFTLRFGILELISGGDEPCPCLLDEPFAAYDCTRIDGAFQILAQEALRRQLLLFTCREDVRELGRSHGACVLEL